MRVVAKLTVALTVAGLLVFGTYGAFLLRSEWDDLRRAATREAWLLGRSLRGAAEFALRDKQDDDIRTTLEAIERIEDSVEIQVFDAVGVAVASTAPLDSLDQEHRHLVHAAMARRHSQLSWDPPDDPQRILLAMPLLRADGQVLGGLLLQRPLDDLHRDLAATRRNVLWSVLAFVCTTGILGLTLGTVYIGRPLQRAVYAMREVRRGDLNSTVPVQRRDELAQLAREFNRMVADLREARARLDAETEARRRLQRHLQDADKLITIGQLSAGLAHEIGSPLQVINGRARQLAGATHDPGAVERIGTILVEQTDRITRIVDQLLRFARRRPSQRIAVDVADSVRSVVDLLAFEARRRGLRLVARSEPGLPLLVADPDQIQQVALNLLTNAMNATPQGGEIVVTIAAAREPASDAGAIRLEVHDTGCGIDPDEVGRIFEPFFTLRSEQGGTGLGLAIVKAIVTDQGGTVEVESTRGVGSRFRVDLPLTARRDGSTPPPAAKVQA